MSWQKYAARLHSGIRSRILSLSLYYNTLGAMYESAHDVQAPSLLLQSSPIICNKIYTLVCASSCNSINPPVVNIIECMC